MTMTEQTKPDWKWWCESCGTLTNDGECDCTAFTENAGTQRLRRYHKDDKADDTYRAAVAEIERLRAALTTILKHMDGNGMSDWKVAKLARSTLEQLAK